MATITDDNAVAEEVHDRSTDAIDALDEAGMKSGLATVLTSDDLASETYVLTKQRDCEEVGIEASDYELDPETPADGLYSLVDDLNNDDEVHGIPVQMPVSDHVDDRAVLRRIDPAKDADGFHPESVSRLVAGDACFRPCTPYGVQKLLATADVETEGVDVIVVNRSGIVGKPMANLSIQKTEGGNAAVIVYHSRTDGLAVKTRGADIVVAVAGVPELVTGDMLSEGVVVIDVGVNRIDADNEKGYELVGDAEFDFAKEKASAITPVPGGVGPMTCAMLLWNTAKAATETEDVNVDLP